MSKELKSLIQFAEMSTNTPEDKLALAAECGELAAVKAMLASGVNVNGKCQLGRQITALFSAVAKDRADVTLFLLKHGANPNATDHVGSTPVFDAVEYASWDSLALLVAAGADVNVKRGGGESPLQSALSLNSGSYTGHRPAVAILLAAGAKGVDTLSQKIMPSELAEARARIEAAKAKLK